MQLGSCVALRSALGVSIRMSLVFAVYNVRYGPVPTVPAVQAFVALFRRGTRDLFRGRRD